MTQPENTIALVSQAQTHVQQAVALWRSSDLANVFDSREFLEAAAAELREAEATLRASSPANLRAFEPFAPKMTTALRALKRDTGLLERVMDASSAFLRGLELVNGTAAPGYRADGQVRSDTPPLSSSRMEG